jgi:competence protein ComEC
VDVLKVAHHGSADEGLEALLERTAPKLALISVGENGYGHPAPETVSALEQHGVPVMRTDRSGEVVIEAGPAGWSVAAGG